DRCAVHERPHTICRMTLVTARLQPCKIDSVTQTSYPLFPPDWFAGGSNGNPNIPVGQELGNDANSLHANSPCDCWGDPVNTGTGNFFESATDALLPGVGIPFTFVRSYNSLDTSQSVMGPGWTFSYNVFLTFPGGGDVVVHTEDGQQ